MRTAFLALAAAMLVSRAAGDDANGRLRVSLGVQDPAKAKKAEVILRAIDDSRPQQSLPVSTDRPAIFEAAAGTTWELLLRSDELWAPAQRVTFEVSEIARELAAWPAGVVTGKVQVEAAAPSVEPLSEIQVSIENPPRQGGRAPIPPGSAATCPVAKDGRFVCRLPATTLDLAIGAPGYAAQYRWDVSVSPSEPRDIQTITLRKGASILAWLASETLKTLDEPESATATLYRATAATSTIDPVARRLAAAAAISKADRRGAFQLSGIGAGTYTLLIEAPGFAPSAVYPVEISEGASVVLRRPIALDRPLTVRLHLQPPDHAPEWSVGVRRIATLDEGPPLRGEVQFQADTGGNVTVDDISPGTYRVTVRDKQGNTLALKDLRIAGPADTDYVITVGGRLIPGRITLGGEPLRARMKFGGRSGAVQVSADSDDEGNFSVFLPAQPKWPVDIASDSPHIATSITVSTPEGDQPLEIKVPKSSVAGRVISAYGEPVKNASVRIVSDVAINRVTTDATGRFVVSSVPTGKIILTALSEGMSSRPLTLTIADDENRDGIQLQLLANRQLDVRLLGGTGPLVGAEVAAYAMDGTRGLRSAATTDLDGSFQLTIATSVNRLLIFVGVPGAAFQIIDFPVPEAETVTASVPVEPGGTLKIISRPGFSNTLSYGPNAIPLSELFSWMRRHGQIPSPPDVTVPHIATGTYRACTVPRDGNETPVCRQGILTQGGTLVLDLAH